MVAASVKSIATAFSTAIPCLIVEYALDSVMRAQPEPRSAVDLTYSCSHVAQAYAIPLMHICKMP